MRNDGKTVWFWANGCWCDATPGEFTALSKLHGIHMGVVDVSRKASHDIVQHAVDEAIELLNTGGGDFPMAPAPEPINWLFYGITET